MGKHVPKLKQVIRLDSIKLDKTYFTEEGYLVDEPIVTTVGIFEYTNSDGSIRRELRLPQHVFDPTSLATYEGKPVIVTHEAGVVDKNNVEQEHIGTILSKGYQDGEAVRAKIIIHNTDEMRESGLRELSLGYNLILDETPGVWRGQPYDAIQTNIEINHLALVGDARAGSTARLNIDGKQKMIGGKLMSKRRARRGDDLKMTPEDFKEVMELYSEIKEDYYYDEEKKVYIKKDEKADSDKKKDESKNKDKNKDAEKKKDEGSAYDKVVYIKDEKEKNKDADDEPKNVDEAIKVIKKKDEDIDTLLDYIEELEAKADYDAANKDEDYDEDEEKKDEKNKDESKDESKSLNADAADALFRKRIELVRLGDRLNIDGIDSMSIIEAKKAVIKKVTPNMRLDGRGKTYINAAFELAKDTLDSRKGTDYQRSQMFNRDGRRSDDLGETSAEAARKRMIERQIDKGGKE